MKVLFAYNGPIKKDRKGNFYGNELNDKLIERYKDLGREVTFLVRVMLITDEETKRMNPIASSEFNVIEVPQFNSPIQLFRNYYKIRKIIKDAMLIHDVLIARLPSFIARIAIDNSRKLGKPCLVEVVGCPWDALRFHGLFGKLIAPFAFFRMRHYTRKAPFVVYVTQTFLQKRYPNFNVHKGISDVIITDVDSSILERRIESLKQRDFLKKPIRIGSVGSYNAGYKGQEFGIRVIGKLKERGLFCVYTMVGRGNPEKLRRLAEELGVLDRIEFLGEISHSRIFSFLDDIDVYIQPSKQDGLPRALVEAMSRGCSCWGTRIGGIPELLDDDRIFSSSNCNDLAEIFSHLNTSILMDDAIKNFEVAKNYSITRLDIMRKSFFAKFKSSYTS